VLKVYRLEDTGPLSELKRIRCVNEDTELQALLERNPDLLPGDQISPDDPSRWLLIKREMPVEDPSSGGARWSIDFLFADQNGMPTFVECKRFNDTRARREIIGQMLEYAANGHYYWTAELLREYAEATSMGINQNLQECIAALQPEIGDSVDDFFDTVHENLREGQLRLVFFMEEAPQELKSIIGTVRSPSR